MHHSGLLGMFSGFNCLNFVLVFLFVPETSSASIGVQPEIDLGSLCSMSLEELSYIFGIRTYTTGQKGSSKQVAATCSPTKVEWTFSLYLCCFRQLLTLGILLLATRIMTKIHIAVFKYRWDRYIRRKSGVEQPGDMYRMPIYQDRELDTLDEEEQQHPILNGAIESRGR